MIKVNKLLILLCLYSGNALAQSQTAPVSSGQKVSEIEDFKSQQNQAKMESFNAFGIGKSSYGISMGGATSKVHGVKTITPKNFDASVSNIDGSPVQMGITQGTMLNTSPNGETQMTQDKGSIPVGTNFLTDTPKAATPENRNNANYRACIRVLINNDMPVQNVLKKCKEKNPDAVDIYESQQQEINNGDVSYVNSQHSVVFKNGREISSDSSLPQNSGTHTKSNMEHIQPIIPTYVGSANSGPISHQDCDVSRDIKVILDPKCMYIQSLDDDINQRIGGGNGGIVPPVNPQREEIIQAPLPVEHKGSMTCDLAIIPDKGNVERTSFKPKTALDCLKKAIALSQGIKGEINIIMTGEDGAVSSAICNKTEANKKPICKMN